MSERKSKSNLIGRLRKEIQKTGIGKIYFQLLRYFFVKGGLNDVKLLFWGYFCIRKTLFTIIQNLLTKFSNQHGS